MQQRFTRGALLALLVAAAAPATALDFKPSARFNGAGTYTKINEPANYGITGDLFLVPAMKQGEWTLIPLLGAVGREAGKVEPEDTLFIESYTFLAKPQLRWERGAATYKLFGGAKHTINKETKEEAWSTGRYDYEEFGAGLGGDWKAPLPCWATPAPAWSTCTAATPISANWWPSRARIITPRTTTA
jgi:hypothetical protein